VDACHLNLTAGKAAAAAALESARPAPKFGPWVLTAPLPAGPLFHRFRKEALCFSFP